jgi:hypothetical protein
MKESCDSDIAVSVNRWAILFRRLRRLGFIDFRGEQSFRFFAVLHATSM